MTNLAIFDLRGALAHFRRPDTMGTQATYPFITRTALRGLAASILGRQELPPDVRCGVRLLSPVKTVAQELSMHGKSWVSGGDEARFHRPTAIELVVKPHYRVYYSGPLTEELGERIRNGQSHYHTYLGSAYCLTFPEWVTSAEDIEAESVAEGDPVTCPSVVPSMAIQRLLPANGREYARVGGLLHEYIGDRKFRGTLSVIYEVNGGPLHFLPATGNEDSLWRFCEVPGEGTVCLW